MSAASAPRQDVVGAGAPLFKLIIISLLYLGPLPAMLAEFDSIIKRHRHARAHLRRSRAGTQIETVASLTAAAFS